MHFCAEPHDKLCIDLEIDARSSSSDPYALVHLTLNETVIGDPYHVEPARPLAASLRAVAAERAARRKNHFSSAGPKQLFDCLYALLFVDDGACDKLIDIRWRRYSPHLALPRGMEVFDEWAAFLVEIGRVEILVARRLECDSGEIWTHLEPGEYESLLTRAAGWLEQSAGP